MAHHSHSQASNRIAQRNMVRSVACPECKAQAGHHCIRTNGGKRYASHQPRWDAYRELIKEPEKE